MNARMIDDETWQFAQDRLQEQWSPEQISNHAAISLETVYQRVYADKRDGRFAVAAPALPEAAPETLRQALTGAASSPTASPLSSVRLSSKQRSRIGDWEADTIIGKNHQQAIVSLVERKSGFTLIRKVERKTAHAVGQAVSDCSSRIGIR